MSFLTNLQAYITRVGTEFKRLDSRHWSAAHAALYGTDGLVIGSNGRVYLLNAGGDASADPINGGGQLADDWRYASPIEIPYSLGGQFLLDPNEINGWGSLGPIDNTNSQDVGNVGAQINQLAGGLMYPFDVRVKRFSAWHRNNNVAVEPWGWALVSQEKFDDSTAETNTTVIDQVGDNGGSGPNDYGDNLGHFTDIAVDFIHPAFHTLFLGVAAPTAVDTNRYVQIMSGCLSLEMV